MRRFFVIAFFTFMALGLLGGFRHKVQHHRVTVSSLDLPNDTCWYQAHPVKAWVNLDEDSFTIYNVLCSDGMMVLQTVNH